MLEIHFNVSLSSNNRENILISIKISSTHDLTECNMKKKTNLFKQNTFKSNTLTFPLLFIFWRLCQNDICCTNIFHKFFSTKSHDSTKSSMFSNSGNKWVLVIKASYWKCFQRRWLDKNIADYISRAPLAPPYLFFLF